MTDQTPEKQPPHDPKRVMVVVAHPDDIEFGCAGSVAMWTEQGAEVIYVLLTNGAAGSNEVGVNPYDLALQREEEQHKAAAKVGVTHVIFLRNPDGALEPTLELRREVTRLIRRYKPDRVICQDPSTWFVEDRYVNHPDHRAAGEIATYAVFPSSESRLAFPELLEEGLEPHRVTDLWLMLTLNANHFVDISDYIDQKIDALYEHKTQLGEEALHFVRERSAQQGEQIGVAYAEGYRVMRINDPVDDTTASRKPQSSVEKNPA